MAVFLSIVEQVFAIEGRGLVVVPGVPRGSELRVQIGSALLLKPPRGEPLRTVVRGLEMVRGGDSVPLLLGREIGREQVPPGTELWLE